jgi:hypothetical protein
LASMGRRRANATYFESHGVDLTSALSFSMDMTSLILEDKLDPLTFVHEIIQHFVQDVNERIQRVS